MGKFSDALKEQEVKTSGRFSSRLKGDPPPDIFELAPGGLDDPILRARLSFFGDDPVERQKAFVQEFPEGQLTTQPVFGTEVFRTGPDQPFRPVDRPFFAKAGSLGEFASETAGDIADLAGQVPSLAGEALATVATRGGSFLPRIAKIGAGGALGEATRQTAQSLASTQADALKSQADQIIGAGIQGAIGGAAGSAIAGVSNLVFRGRGLARISEPAEQALQASQRLAPETPLLPQQLTDIPIITTLGKQAQSLLPTVTRYIQRQQDTLAQQLRDAPNQQDLAQVIPRSVNALNQASDEIVRAAQKRPTELRAGGRALQQGVQAWEVQSGRQVDELYSLAREQGEPTFDLARVNEAIQTLEGRTRPAQLLEGGLAPTNPIDPKVQAWIDRFRAFDPQGLGLDELKGLRSQLHDLTLVGPEGAREAQLQARRLFGAMTETMENPVSGATDLFRRANQAAAIRFGTREKLAVINVAKSETPSELAARLAQPGQLDNLVVLRQILNREAPGKYEKFQKAFLSSALKSGLKGTLDAFDDKTLNLLIDPRKQRFWRQAGEALDRLQRTGIADTAQQQAAVRPFINQLFGDGSANIRNLKFLINSRGGPNTDFGKSIRSAVLDEIGNRVIRRERGFLTIDPNAFDSTLRDFRGRGILDLVTKRDVGLLDDLQKTLEFRGARPGADAGTSLQKAEAVAGLRSLSADAIQTILENVGTGRFLTSKVGRTLLTGKGRTDPSDFTLTRLITQFVNEVAIPDEGTESIGEGARGLATSAVGGTARSVEDLRRFLRGG